MSATTTKPTTPQRYIFDDDDLAKFLESSAKKDLLRFTSALGKSCIQSEFEYDPIDPLIGLSPPLATLHGSLQSMIQWVNDIPPYDRSMARFGNPAFKKWHDRLKERSVSIIYAIVRSKQLLSENDTEYDINQLSAAADDGKKSSNVIVDTQSIEDIEDRNIVTELVAYLQASFGHEIRLDYGTGHECSFHVFLWCLCKLGFYGSNPGETPSMNRLKAVTIAIWSAYLQITRQLQVIYMLEPAGSHGVWGLDDYYCLPFYFGSCQLQGDSDGNHELVSPNSIHNDTLLNKHGKRLLYFGCIQFIKQLKKNVPFYESSPMLNDISNLGNWDKVSMGLLRLFEGEVLNKRQVVQHFVFGTIFSADWTPSQPHYHSKTTLPTTTTFRESTSAMPSSNHHKNSSSSAVPDCFMPSTKAPWAK